MRKTARKTIAALLSALMVLSAFSAGLVMPAFAAGNTDAYSLTFNANGGEGDEATQGVYNRKAVPLNDNPFTKTGYHLTGWNTETDGSGAAYADGANVTNPVVSYRARYIRVYAAGNTNNDSTGAYMANHLSELQVIDAQGNNAALNKSGDVVTDGNIATTTGCYYSYGAYYGKSDYYQLDLGAPYDVQTVNMYRYWEDVRMYHNTVVVLSENGTFEANDRFVLFNADYQNRYGFGNGIDMEYPEGQYGLTMNVSDVRRANTYEARYIRVYAAGNDRNDADGTYMANPFVELVVNDINGNNVALNKRSDVGVNGVVDTNQYMAYGDFNGTGNYYQVDFGGVYDIASIGMWRYWADSRTYYDTVIVLSRNGTFAENDRFVVFNADDTGRFGFGRGTDKDYVETARGKAFYVEYEPENLPTFDARYVRVYIAGNDKNAAGGAPMANHIVELKVMADGDNVAYGRSGGYATDGTLNVEQYEYFGEYFSRPNYFQVDFGGVYPVSSVSLWGYWADARVNYNLVIVLSKNGTFTGDDLLVLWNADSANRFGFGRGSDPAYNETSAGRTFAVPENGGDLNTVTARYIRVYDYGNDSNDIMGYPRCDQVAELAAYTANGVNVASVGTAQDASIIDGNIAYGVYYGYGTGYGLPNEYFWVDLGQEFELAKIRLWRYWVDTRTFHSQVIALSRNGTFAGDDLTVIWNTDHNNRHGFGAGTDAAYVETAAGHEFRMPDFNAAPSARARYVRVYSGGSYANDVVGQSYCEHISEIQVFAGGSENLAYGKTGSVATDGNTSDASYDCYGGFYGRPNYFEVDLGGVYDVTSVKLWQYYRDNRTYHNNVVVLSENGTFAGNDYTVIFNADYCNMHGFGRGFDNEYVESAAGREFKIRNVYAPSSGNKTLYAQWAPNAYTVTFDGQENDGGTVPGDIAATYDAAFTVPADRPTRTGYGFTGWNTASDGSGTAFSPAQENVSNLTTENGGTVTLYAQWEIIHYTLTPDAQGGECADEIDYTIESGDVIPEPTRSGYDFTGWTVTAAEGTWTVGDTPAPGTALAGNWGDVTLQAGWTVRHDTAYTVNNYYMNADGTYPDAPQSQTFFGTTEDVVTAANAASAPAHYSLDTENSDEEIAILGGGDAALNLYYKLDKYTVTFNVDGTETGADYYYGAVPAYGGEEPTLAATDEFTYTFLGWTDAPAEPGAAVPFYTTLPAVTGDATYYPYFGAAVNSYDITFIVDGAETVQSFPYGATPVYDGVPAKDADAQYTYTFSGWSPAIEAVTGEAIYTAQFDGTLNRYPVFVSGGAGSAISLASGNYDYGTELDFTVTVDAAYSNGVPVVTVNGAALDLPEPAGGVYACSVTVTGETEISVSDLAKNTYTIVFIVNGTETETTVAHGDTPGYNGTPSKAADDENYYVFTGWEPEIVAAVADATYTAQFDPVPFPAHEHEFTEKVRTVAATCVSGGFDEYVCECGMTEKRNETAADPANHAKAAITVGAHEATEENDGYTGDLICPACGVTITEGSVVPKTVVPHEHEFVFVRTVAATCIAKGYDEYACACGETERRNETATIAANNHAGTILTVGKRAATETQDGYTGDKVCSACGKTVKRGTVIPKTGSGETPAVHTHTFDTFVRHVDADCCTKGYDEYKCDCGMTEKRNETASVDAGSHAGAILTVGKRAATETQDGYTGDKVCSACGKTVETGTVIPKTGSGETPTEPEEPTVYEHGCPICGKTHDGNIIQKLIGLVHTFLYMIRTLFGSVKK
ncbi:MAG: InlB B-repeat-containing protein [Clostridia bacterium]|nr:InlB B-repeat-containing protein [Clostridia bacterium]